MDIQFIEKDQVWQDETTKYWFSVDGENYCIADQNGQTKLLDSEGYPIDASNDHDRIKDALMPEYEKRIHEF